MSDSILIGTLPKNSLDELRVSLSEFRGHHLVDVRVFSNFSGVPSDEKKATKKGATINVASLPELIRLFQDAEVEARRLKLLPDEGAAS
jgi:hypothetical protein